MKHDFKIFISYSSKDLEHVLIVKELLEKKDFYCWMAPYSITPGSDYASEITSAISSSNVMIAFLSDNFQNSIWTRKEINLALDNKIVIIPWELSDIQLSKTYSFLFSDIQRIAAYKDFNLSFNELIILLSKLKSSDNQEVINDLYMDYQEIGELIKNGKFLTAEKLIDNVKQTIKKIDPLSTDKAKVYLDALRIAVEDGTITCSKIQRKLSVGYAFATDIVEWMVEQGFVVVDSQDKYLRKTVMTPEAYEQFRASLKFDND